MWKKNKRILSKIKAKYWKRTHDFGVNFYNSIDQARTLDAKNGNTLWQEARDNEMDNNAVAFDLLKNLESGVP